MTKSSIQNDKAYRSEWQSLSDRDSSLRSEWQSLAFRMTKPNIQNDTFACHPERNVMEPKDLWYSKDATKHVLLGYLWSTKHEQ